MTLHVHRKLQAHHGDEQDHVDDPGHPKPNRDSSEQTSRVLIAQSAGKQGSATEDAKRNDKYGKRKNEDAQRSGELQGAPIFNLVDS